MSLHVFVCMCDFVYVCVSVFVCVYICLCVCGTRVGVTWMLLVSSHNVVRAEAFSACLKEWITTESLGIPRRILPFPLVLT